MVEEISWADATIDEEPQPVLEQPVADSQSNWDQTANFAMEALGGVQALGGVATGALAWPVGKVVGAVGAPFTEGGAPAAEQAFHEMIAIDPPAEGTPARAGHDLIMKPVEGAMDFVFGPGEDINKFVTELTGDKNIGWIAGTGYEFGVGAAMHGVGKVGKKVIKTKVDKVKKAGMELAVAQRRQAEAVRLRSKRAEASASKDVDAKKLAANKALNELNESGKKHAPSAWDDFIETANRRNMLRQREYPQANDTGIWADFVENARRTDVVRQKRQTGSRHQGADGKAKSPNQLWEQSRDSGLTPDEFLAQRAQPIDPRQQQLNQLQQISAAADRTIKSKSATAEEVRQAIAEKAEADQLLQGYGEISGQTGARPVDLGERSRLMDRVVVDEAAPPLMDAQPTRATELRARAAGVTPAEFLARRQAEMQGRQAPPVLDRRFVGEQDRGVRSIIEQSEPAKSVDVPMAEQAIERQAAVDVGIENQRIADANAAANELTMRKKDAQAAQLIEANDAAYRRKMSERLNKAITNRPLDSIIKDVGEIYNELLTEGDSVSRVRVGDVLEQAGEVYEQAMSARRRRDLVPAGEGKRTAAEIKQEAKEKRQKPIVAYRGFGDGREFRGEGRPIHLSSDPGIASTYPEGKGNYLGAYEVSLKNPKIYTAAERHKISMAQGAKDVAELKKQGYDGAIFVDNQYLGNVTEIVAFDKSQTKKINMPKDATKGINKSKQTKISEPGKKPNRVSALKAAAKRLEKRLAAEGKTPKKEPKGITLGMGGGNIDIKALSKSTRAAVELTIVELRKQGKKISKFIEEQGYTKDMLIAMRQVAREMDRDKKLLEKAEPQGAVGRVVKQRKTGSYEDKITGETKDLYAPKVLDYEKAMIEQLLDVKTRQGGFEVSGNFMERLGDLHEHIMERRRNEEGTLAREKGKNKRDFKQWKKEAGRKGVKELEVEQYRKQEGGPEIWRNMGKGEVPVLDIELRHPEAAKVHTKIRAKYDELWERFNKARELAGEPPMDYTEFYSTYLTDLEAMGINPMFKSTAELNNAIYQHKRTVSFGPAKKRIADKRKRVVLETDPFKILDRYNDMALNYIHHAETLAWVKELIGDYKEPFKVPKTDPITGKPEFSNSTGKQKVDSYRGLRWANEDLYNSIESWRNHLTGDMPKSDVSPFWQKAMRVIANNVVVSTMSYNIGSYLNQLGAGVQANTVLGNKFQAQGVYDLIRSAHPDSKLWSFMRGNSNEMARRYGAFDVTFGEIMRPGKLARKYGKIGSVARGINTTKKAVGRAGMTPVAITDYMTAAATWFGAYRQGMSILNNSKRAIQWADDVVIRTQGSGARSEVAPIQRSPMGKLVTTLQTFAISNWNFLAKDVMGYKNPKVTSADRFARIGRFMIGSAILNYILEDVIGVNSPMPNLIKTAMDSIENGDDPHEVALKLVIEATEVVPVVGSVSKFSGPLGGVVTQQLEKALKFRDPKAVAEALARIAGMPGVSQLKKSARQIKQEGSAFDVFTGGRYIPKKKSSSGGRRSRRSRRRSR
jgi:hypothetical protein